MSDPEIDRTFQALADATRRDIVRRVLVGEQSVSDLAQKYSMSFAAVQKHVAVLERAHLVVKERRGREQMVSGAPEAIRSTARLLDAYADLWRTRAQQMTHILTEENERTPS